jgi:hypothetical protein
VSDTQPGEAAGAVLGRYVTLRPAAVGAGEVYEVVEHTAETLTLLPVLPERAIPGVGEDVVCEAGLGEWAAVVRQRHGDRVVIPVPAWIRRSRRRAGYRVPCSAVAHLSLGHTIWAARLEDLSTGGGAITMDAAVPLQEGMAILCLLPQGSTVAEVRSVRSHEHDLLQVVGVAWSEPDDAAREWLRRKVTGRRGRGSARTT